MLKKGTKLNSILTGTCPRCQNESMYVKKNPYQLNQMLTMHEECSHCKLVYQIEPSFFYGAMYVSYAVNVAVGVAAFIISHVFIGLELIPSFIAIVTTLLVLYPPILRVSRNMYINMFVSYDPEVKS
ncbi:DUF983 domain-containing protein [Flavobacterium sp. CYK-55]|uniref:DUF983 domain-containing protein n=1 Tax=Flavobacterium sp. CYK-55 TaxID=2835529 RepID=UPI001BD0512D|nr:DUF983 domain-containing protein [Flavobacterium sp. CYK-55]MBS7785756.1 DUF983 domain-containing protein [Flavobacterium sp. CYK-55]